MDTLHDEMRQVELACDKITEVLSRAEVEEYIDTGEAILVLDQAKLALDTAYERYNLILY